MRIVIRLLACVVIVSSAIAVWTRAALDYVLGPQVTAVCLAIAVVGSVCGVIILAVIRKPNRPQPYQRPQSYQRLQPYQQPQPRPAEPVRHDRAAVAMVTDQQVTRRRAG
jgi:hypothetical protein